MVKLNKKFSFTLKPYAPYSLKLTVHKPAGWDFFTPKEIMDKDTLYTALYIDSSLVGLKIKDTRSVIGPSISISVYTKSAVSDAFKKRVREALIFRLGIDTDLKKFYTFARKDSILKHTVKDLYGMRDTMPSSLFASCILGVCLQMAPLKRSEDMMNRIIENYGREAEFAGKKVGMWPLPKDIAKINVRSLKASCKLGYRAKFISGISRVLSKGTFPSEEDLGALPKEEAKKKLMELPGIGDYAADIILPQGGFPIDAWSVEVFGELFFGRKPHNNRAEIEKVKEEGIRRWGKWSWMGFFYVANDLKNLSKRLNTNLRLI